MILPAYYLEVLAGVFGLLPGAVRFPRSALGGVIVFVPAGGAAVFAFAAGAFDVLDAAADAFGESDFT